MSFGPPEDYASAQVLVKCSEFVKRQTKDSGYSHFDGSWEELEDIVYIELVHTKYDLGIIYRPQTNNNIQPGYKDGVILVRVHPNKFYSATFEIKEDTKLTANFAPRREGEMPFIRVSAKGKKQPATVVDIICYRHDILAEDKDATQCSHWEIIAIKARSSEEEEPMDPMTMARNFLHLPGGTAGDFSAEQFAKSIVFWNSHCMTTSKQKWYRKIKDWFK